MNNIFDVYSDFKIDGLSAPFIGKGNLWVNNTYDKSVGNLTKFIITEAIMNTAPGQLSIVGYDSDLTGIFAPFASLSAGEGKQIEIITNEKAFKEYLEYTSQHIQAVQNVVQGRNDSLIDFRNAIKRPVEGYRLVVLSLDMGLLSNELRAKIALLMRNGPAFGVSFLIISTTFMSIQTTSGKDIELSVNAIAPNITVLETHGNTVWLNLRLPFQNAFFQTPRF
ncbi:MAG: hypothetical protein ACOYJX_07230 [Acutalibacteraceae bacterium]|jgi:hypothetical protein